MKILLLSVCLLAPIMSACDVMNGTVADRCIYVDLYGQKGKELIPILDAFAKAQGLVADKSHPISPSYERKVKTDVVADLVYTMGLGRFGAELTLFRFDKSRSADLLDLFDRLVEEEIAPHYKVTQCTEDQYPTKFR